MALEHRARQNLRGTGQLPALLCLVFASLGFAGAPAHAADTENPEGLGSFFSSMPRIELPDIELPTPFWTSDLKIAKKAWREHDYEKARKYFREESEEGSLVADWYLGTMDRLGLGGPRNDAHAFSYYSRVVERFDPNESSDKRLRIMVDAQVRLADYYRKGLPSASIPRDAARAIDLYKMAAAYGHPAAEYGLGLMIVQGEGMKPKPALGLRWIMKSARKRYAPAEAWLGDICWSGTHVTRDRTRAVMWYILARDSAPPNEAGAINRRLNVMLANVGDSERIEAEARASVWAEQFPVPKSAE